MEGGAVGIQNLRFRRFVLCKLRNFLGRMGLGFGFYPQRGHFSALYFAHLHIQ